MKDLLIAFLIIVSVTAISFLVFPKKEAKPLHVCHVCKPCLYPKEVLRINALYEKYVDDSHYALGKTKRMLRDSVIKYKRLLNLE